MFDRLTVAKLGALSLAGAAVILFAPAANAMSYSTSGDGTQVSLGDTIGSMYDQLTVGAYQGTLQTGTIILNPLTFTAGVNATVPQVYDNLSIQETMTVDAGTPQELTIPFDLSINYSDTLTIIGGATLSFVEGGSVWQVVVNGLTLGPNSGGTMDANLTAQVSDPPAAPLPATLPLFASGLCAIGFFGWLRVRKNAGLSKAA